MGLKECVETLKGAVRSHERMHRQGMIGTTMGGARVHLSPEDDLMYQALKTAIAFIEEHDDAE